MKKKLFCALSLSALFITASLFSSCKKEYSNEEQVPDLTPEIYYKQRAVGSSTDEYRAVRINGANDHKVNIKLPAGWELTDSRHLSEGQDRMVVSAYDPTSKLYSIFINSGINNNVFFQIPAVSSLDPVVVQAIGNSTVPYILYSIHKPNNVVEFGIAGRPPVTIHSNIKIALPANASFVGEPILQTQGDNMTFTTRVEDPISYLYTYTIYKCNLNGGSVAAVVTGEPGVVLTAEQISYPNSLLYSKVKNNGLNTELWTVNLDGSSNSRLDLAFPAGKFLKNKDMARVASDGRLAFLTTTSADNSVNAQEAIYTAKTNGSDVRLVKQFATGVSVGLQSYATYAWY